MNSWIIFLCLYASLVQCQIRRTQNTRLGLLATGLGVAPVPGASNNNNIPGRPNFPLRPPFTGGNNGGNFGGNFGGGFFPQGGGNLIATPPPGIGSFTQPATFRGDECYCLPINQVCDDSILAIFRANTRNGGVNARIVNNRPNQQCTPGDEQLCCPSGVAGPVVRPTFSPIQNINLLTGCGTRTPTPYEAPQTSIADFGEYPWMAVILDTSNGYIGGGTLVSPQYVLTAAHKVFNKSPGSIKVRVGDHDVSRPQDHPRYRHEERQIVQVITHPSFNQRTLQNDVSLLRLSQPVNINNLPHINTACVPEDGQLFDSRRCYVTGFGKNAFQAGQFSPKLKEVDVNIVDTFRCQAQLQKTRLGEGFKLDQNSFICAGGEQGKDACTGDGGSPLVCDNNGRFTVAGLVAFGVGCGQPNVPGVYVNVASFANFINQYVR